MSTISPSEVRIEFLSTQYTGPIEAWEVRDGDTGDVKCSIDIKSPLKACLDESASAGSNSYAIYGVWPGGSWGPKRYSISGLQHERKLLSLPLVDVKMSLIFKINFFDTHHIMCL